MKQMTTIYFVRHAEPNYSNHDDMTRELTEKGLRDRELVTEFLKDKNIELVFSSPYKRAVDTVKHFSDCSNLVIKLIDDFRERRIDSEWIEDFDAFSRRQWSDFSYKFSDGESLSEVQERNVQALHCLIKKHKGKAIVVGSHGTALSTIIKYYDTSFGYDDFVNIKPLMPLIVKFVFLEEKIVKIESINPFTALQTTIYE